MRPIKVLICGALAGAAGTTALNLTTYLDMVVRGRPASSTPEQSVDRLTSLVGVEIPGDEEQRGARRTALGAVMGAAAGVGAGIATAAIRSAAPASPATTLVSAFGIAMVAGNGPMTLLGITRPATWTAEDWAADVVPHLAYAAATAAALEVCLHSR